MIKTSLVVAKHSAFLERIKEIFVFLSHKIKDFFLIKRKKVISWGDLVETKICNRS